MQLRRQHFLLLGLLLFFAGVQFRLVESFTLSEKSSYFVARRWATAAQASSQTSGKTPPTERSCSRPAGWDWHSCQSAPC